MKTPYYFGFGSLVNDETLPDGTRWQKAILKGWRRSWRHPIEGETAWAAMDVVQDSDSSIEGLLVAGGGEIDSYLVAREGGYQSTPLQPEHLKLDGMLPKNAAPCLWVSKSASLNTIPLHLMQSYVDVVMSGYLRNFGEAGLQRFIDSTDNWHLPRIDDRDKPLYPRAVSLSSHERRLIASYLPKTRLIS